MTEVRRDYDLYIAAGETPVQAAQAVLIEQDGRLIRMGFRYTSQYLAGAQAFALDPVNLPLTQGETDWSNFSDNPGLLEDYLPDTWGRKVLAYIAFYRDGIKINTQV